MQTEPTLNQNFADQVANLCIEKYNKLPKTGKPNINESQWNLLSGICLEESGKLCVVALATGTKSLGNGSYSKHGDVLHDSHAEVLTRRAWLRYIYSQMNLCLKGQVSIFNPQPSDIIAAYQDRIAKNQNHVQGEVHTQSGLSNKQEQKNVTKEMKETNNSIIDKIPNIAQKNEDPMNIHAEYNKQTSNDPHKSNTLKFSIKPDVKFHFYTSHTPCGDASIFPRHIKATTLAKIQTQAQRKKMKKVIKRKLEAETEAVDDLKTHAQQLKKPCIRKDQEIELSHHVQTDDLEEASNALTSNLDCSSEDSESDNDLSGDIGSMVQDFHRTGAKILPHAPLKDPKGSESQYHLIGVPRTKPGRGDPTYSMSCSDKIAKWNAVGWEGCLLSTLLDLPIFMSSITIGGGIAFSLEASTRALISRVSHLLHPPTPVLLQSQVIFPAGKRSVKREMKKLGRPISSAHPVGGSIIWADVKYKPLEVAIEGIQQGVSRKVHNAKTNKTSTLQVSSYKLLVQYIQLVRDPQYLNVPYCRIKAMATGYQVRMIKFKDALGNWMEIPDEFRQFSVSDLNETL